MNYSQLIDDMIKEDRDATIKDFLSLKSELIQIERATEKLKLTEHVRAAHSHAENGLREIHAKIPTPVKTGKVGSRVPENRNRTQPETEGLRRKVSVDITGRENRLEKYGCIRQGV